MKKNLRSSFIPLTRTTPSKFPVLTSPFFTEPLDHGVSVQGQCCSAELSTTEAAGVRLALQNFEKSPFLLGSCLSMMATMASFVLVFFSGYFL